MGVGGGFEPGPLGLELDPSCCRLSTPLSIFSPSPPRLGGGVAGLTPPGKPPRRGCRAHLSRVLKDKKKLCSTS